MKNILHIVIVVVLVIPSIIFAKQNSEKNNVAQLIFTGEAYRNQPFIKKIGYRLYFKLIPVKYGWDIWIGNKQRPNNSYCGIVTPPFHGINALYIEGWHFRNSDNSGPNEAGEKNVNAPQEEREFQFVTNESDYKKASEALDKIVYPYIYSEKEVDAAKKEFNEIKKGEGLLKIEKMELGNLIIGEQAWFNKMEFQVWLKLPME